MKRIIIAFGLILTGLALFGQSPRIRLNQITKDSVVGSIVLSSLNDSNMVYSRDFYIGADTSLIFYGTTIIAGGGGGGSFVTLPQLEDSLSNYINNETLSDSLLNYINSLTLSDSLTNYILKTAAFGGDVSGTYDNITVSDDSHNHTISTLTGLQDSLNSRLTIVSIGVGLSGSGTTGSPLVVDTNTIATRAYADGVAGGGGTVTSVAVEAGTGITVSGSPITTSGTITVTNAAPDQTVVLTAGTGITTSGTYPNFTITNSAPDQTVSITGAGINAVTGTYPNFTITGTEVDGSVTNEGSLSVGAGGDNSSTIQSNTSGSTPVTIAGGSNVTVTESGSTITIASTGGGSSFNNLTEDGDTIIVAKHLIVDTTTLFVDAFKDVVGLSKINPDSTALAGQSSVKLDVNGSIKSLFYGMETDSTNQNGGSYNVMSFRYSAPSGSAGNLFANFRSSNNLSTNSSGFFFQRSRGNLSAQSGVLAEDQIGGINFGAALSDGNANTATARINAIADADATSTEAPTRLGFITGGSVSTRAERLTIKSDGKIGIGTTTPSEVLDVDGNARFRNIGNATRQGALSYTSTGVLTTNTSDLRLKTNLQPIESVLNYIEYFKPYTFNWINDIQVNDFGFIAQDVEEIYPLLVFENQGMKGIHYDKLGVLAIKAIQEQQAIIESQKTEIDTLKAQYEALLQRIINLENK
jgi:hypothetical protein